jgi:hypothetical protein
MVNRFYPRHLEARLRAALRDTPVVMLTGARQSGKSTLAGRIAAEAGLAYVTLDDATTLAATRDATAFLQGLGERAVIDEVQRAPWLFPAIKVAVDRARRPGRFLLTGSANVLLVPRVSESLAGRMEILRLWSLSQGEILGIRERFLEALFARHRPTLVPTGAAEQGIESVIARGGYPELVARKSAARREAWLSAYVTTLLERDVRDLANIEGLSDLPRVLGLLATRTGALLNVAEVSRDSGVAHTTLKRYLALLEAAYIIAPLSAWSRNVGKRLIKAAKLYFPDSAVAAHLGRASAESLRADRGMIGPLLENFVLGELRKQADWAERAVEVHYFRTAGGQEVDFVLEGRDGRIAGVEVKAARTLSGSEFGGLRLLAAVTGSKFVRGVVLYLGNDVLQFADRLWAMPVSALWRMR